MNNRLFYFTRVEETTWHKRLDPGFNISTYIVTVSVLFAPESDRHSFLDRHIEYDKM